MYMAKKLKKTSKPTKPKTLLDLERIDCRWPIGEPRQPDFHFCGAPQVAGRPYCDLHTGAWHFNQQGRAISIPRLFDSQPPQGDDRKAEARTHSWVVKLMPDAIGDLAAKLGEPRSLLANRAKLQAWLQLSTLLFAAKSPALFAE
jgi:hypothetical protein